MGHRIVGSAIRDFEYDAIEKRAREARVSKSKIIALLIRDYLNSGLTLKEYLNTHNGSADMAEQEKRQ